MAHKFMRNNEISCVNTRPLLQEAEETNKQGRVKAKVWQHVSSSNTTLIFGSHPLEKRGRGGMGRGDDADQFLFITRP